MLERAPGCVEPAAQHLFRRLENPTRSTRLLHQSFWRRSRGEGNGPVWWLAFLKAVGESSQAQCLPGRAQNHNGGDIDSTDKAGLNGFRPSETNLSTRRSERRLGISRLRRNTGYEWIGQHRLYTTPRREEGKSSMIAMEEQEVEVFKNPFFPSGETVQSKTGEAAPENAPSEADHGNFESPTLVQAPKPQTPSSSGKSKTPHTSTLPSETLGSLLSSERRDAYEEVWQAFIRLDSQVKHASEVLQYLSTSEHVTDLDRALRAYKMIPRYEKSSLTYESAIEAAVRKKNDDQQFNPTLALKIHAEAVSRSRGAASSRILLTHLLKSNLWGAATMAWLQHQAATRTDAKGYEKDSLWDDVAEVLDLPEKLLLLMFRIERARAFPLSNTAQLQLLATHLLYRVVSNSNILAIITGKGIMSLLDHADKLGLLRTKHYLQALHALRLMRDARNRSQLATLLYRNLRYRFPDFKVPKWVLGSLVSMSAESDYPPSAMRFLLDEFTTLHGRPDQLIYQKVLTSCAHSGEPETVHEIFRRYLRDHGVTKDLAFLTPLLYVYARVGDIENTQRQFERLFEQFKVKPNTYCWNILLLAYSRARDHRGAFETFQKMRGQHIKPDAFSFGTLMGICSNLGDTTAVHNLVEMARQEGIRGTHAMVDTLVHSYCLNDELENAENLVETATNMDLEGTPTRMWNILLRHYAFEANSEAILRIQERMRELSVKPDAMTYAALMTALVVLGKTKDAAQILRSLHFSQHLTATLFHYSIVLHGFAQEGNRDMASVIYNEILERFPRPSLSARLSMLHLQGRRDTKNWQENWLAQRFERGPQHQFNMPHAMEFLVNTILETSKADLATKDPQPGFGRRSPKEAILTAYIEYLLSSFNLNRVYQSADKLLSHFEPVLEASSVTKPYQLYQSIQLLTAMMIGSTRRRHYAEVEDLWDRAVSQAVSLGRQVSGSVLSHTSKSESFKGPQSNTEPRSTTEQSSPSQASNRTIASNNRHKKRRRLDLLKKWGRLPADATFEDLDRLTQPSAESILEEDGLVILPSQRYLLSATITRYMLAISAQDRVSCLPTLVGKLERVGFKLTSRNWNIYVQVLSQSSIPAQQLLAFQTFEKMLLPGTPPWPLLRRSKWTSSRTASDTEDTERPEPLSRDFIEKFRPGQNVPTYFTVVYLGNALMKFRARGEAGDKLDVRLLWNQAPGTVSLVTQMPYLKDRVQGVLLRGRQVQGDPIKRPRRQEKADRAGLRGSRSPLDHIPVDYIKKLQENMLKMDSKMQIVPDGEENRLRIAEEFTGEILRTPQFLESVGLEETEEVFLARLRTERKEKLALAEQIRLDAEQKRMVSDSNIGEPHIGSAGVPTHYSRKDSIRYGAQDDGLASSERDSLGRPIELHAPVRRPLRKRTKMSQKQQPASAPAEKYTTQDSVLTLEWSHDRMAGESLHKPVQRPLRQLQNKSLLPSGSLVESGSEKFEKQDATTQLQKRPEKELAPELRTGVRHRLAQKKPHNFIRSAIQKKDILRISRDVRRQSKKQPRVATGAKVLKVPSLLIRRLTQLKPHEPMQPRERLELRRKRTQKELPRVRVRGVVVRKSPAPASPLIRRPQRKFLLALRPLNSSEAKSSRPKIPTGEMLSDFVPPQPLTSRQRKAFTVNKANVRRRKLYTTQEQRARRQEEKRKRLRMQLHRQVQSAEGRSEESW